MSEKWSKEFDSCFQVGSIEEIADALEKRSGSEENALAMLAMTAFTLMTRRGICEMQNVAPDGKGIRLELIGFRENETIPDTRVSMFQPKICILYFLRPIRYMDFSFIHFWTIMEILSGFSLLMI